MLWPADWEWFSVGPFCRRAPWGVEISFEVNGGLKFDIAVDPNWRIGEVRPLSFLLAHEETTLPFTVMSCRQSASAIIYEVHHSTAAPQNV